MSVDESGPRKRGALKLQIGPSREENLRRVRTVCFALLLGAFVMLGGAELYRLFRSTSDGTVWTNVPSGLYVETIPGDLGGGEVPGEECPRPPRPGDFLVSIDEKKRIGRRAVAETLEELDAEKPVSLEVYRPVEAERATCTLRASAVAEMSLRDLGAALLLRRVDEGGPADRAGIRTGDVLLGIGDHSFEEGLHIGPVSALVAILRELEARLRFGWAPSKRGQVDLEAQHVLQTYRPGERTVFRVLRQGRLRDVEVKLERQKPTVWLWLIYGLALLSLVVFGTLTTKISSECNISDPEPYTLFALDAALFLLLGALMQSDPSGDPLTWARHLLGVGTLLGVLPWAFPVRTTPRSPSFLVLLPVALGMTYFLWYWHRINPLGADRAYSSLSGLRAKVFGVGEPFFSPGAAVPTLTILVFVLALFYLAWFWRGVVRPVSPRHLEHRSLCRAATSGTAEELERLLDREAPKGRGGYYAVRFLRLIRRLNRDPADDALERERRNILEEDEAYAAGALIPVEWCETALPVLGFLGTVIGLAHSLADVQSIGESVRVQELLANVLSAFEGVGYAFDTTFLGLASMLVVAAVHTALRRSASRGLAEADAVFQTTVDRWLTASATRELQVLNMDQKVARTKLQETFEEVLLHHPAPAIAQTRDILLRPSVMFEKLSPPPDEELRKDLEGAATGKWSYTALGLSPSSGAALLLAKTERGERWLGRLDLAEPGRNGSKPSRPPTSTPLHRNCPVVKAIFPAEEPERLTLWTTSGELLSGSWSGESLKKVELPDGSRPEEPFPVMLTKVGKLNLVVLGTEHPEGGWQVVGVRPGSTDARSLGRMGPELQDESFAVHGASGTIFRLGCEQTERKRRILQWKRLEVGGSNEPGSVDVPGELWEAIWPEEGRPAKLLPLGSSRVVVAMEAGLVYWNLDRHRWRRLPREKWLDGVPELMVGGADGWFAAIHRNALRMWQVRSPGVLIPYRSEVDSFPVSGLKEEDGEAVHRIQATADGKLLLAIMKDGELATWRFPTLSLDD